MIAIKSQQMFILVNRIGFITLSKPTIHPIFIVFGIWRICFLTTQEHGNSICSCLSKGSTSKLCQSHNVEALQDNLTSMSMDSISIQYRHWQDDSCHATTFQQLRSTLYKECFNSIAFIRIQVIVI